MAKPILSYTLHVLVAPINTRNVDRCRPPPSLDEGGDQAIEAEEVCLDADDAHLPVTGVQQMFIHPHQVPVFVVWHSQCGETQKALQKNLAAQSYSASRIAFSISATQNFLGVHGILGWIPVVSRCLHVPWQA